jgi:hypothetical protein
MKVIGKIALMSADAGQVSTDEKIIAIAGSSREMISPPPCSRLIHTGSSKLRQKR